MPCMATREAGRITYILHTSRGPMRFKSKPTAPKLGSNPCPRMNPPNIPAFLFTCILPGEEAEAPRGAAQPCSGHRGDGKSTGSVASAQAAMATRTESHLLPVELFPVGTLHTEPRPRPEFLPGAGFSISKDIPVSLHPQPHPSQQGSSQHPCSAPSFSG